MTPSGGGDGENKLYGDAGNDKIYGGKDKDIIEGGADNDEIYGYDGFNELSGGSGDDYIYGGKDRDIVHTGSGDDDVWTYDGDDEVFTNDGALTADRKYIYLGTGANTFHGGAGRDYVYSDTDSGKTSTADLGSNHDRYFGGDGIDVVHGDAGNDDIYGGNGNNRLFGDAGNDYITAGKGNDTINGGTGYDTIDAGTGNNIINVGKDTNDDVVYVYNNSGAVDNVYCTKSNDSVVVWGANRVFYQGKDLIIDSSRGNRVIVHDRAEDEADPENPEAPKIWDENGNLWQPNADGVWEPTPIGAPLAGPDVDDEALKKYVEQDKFDPVVIDLNGNGIEMLQANGNYFFDLNGDNIGEEIDWVAPTDGFLVHDTNNNGQVDGIDELFGNASIDGYDELSTFDSNGDGVETVSEANGVHFDHDGNSFSEKSGWVGKDDGLLVRDINGNGDIDNGTELFGNNSVLSNGQKATNGFEALKDFAA